jgi:hypothetical protein
MLEKANTDTRKETAANVAKKEPVVATAQTKRAAKMQRQTINTNNAAVLDPTLDASDTDEADQFLRYGLETLRLEKPVEKGAISGNVYLALPGDGKQNEGNIKGADGGVGEKGGKGTATEKGKETAADGTGNGAPAPPNAMASP